jgi:hypothetical protein
MKKSLVVGLVGFVVFGMLLAVSLTTAFDFKDFFGFGGDEDPLSGVNGLTGYAVSGGNCGSYSDVSPDSAEASEQYSSRFAGSKAVDGLTSTHWFGKSSGSFPKWIDLDLGVEKCVNGLTVDFYGADVPITFDVSVSVDGENWERLLVDKVVSSADPTQISFSEGRGRYVRISESSSRRRYGGALTEVTVSVADFTAEGSGGGGSTCVDSDGGLNFTVAGNVTVDGSILFDYCLGGRYVTENYCSGNINLSLTQDCSADGRVCDSGRCVASGSGGGNGFGCTESDGGYNLVVAGNTVVVNSSGSFSYSDRCENDELVEYSCMLNVDSSETTIRSCGTKRACDSGRCVSDRTVNSAHADNSTYVDIGSKVYSVREKSVTDSVLGESSVTVYVTVSCEGVDDVVLGGGCRGSNNVFKDAKISGFPIFTGHSLGYDGWECYARYPSSFGSSLTREERSSSLEAYAICSTNR